ncbi:MAG: rhodanese-like domain-containing protein [Pseudomonadota bacterium]|nr:rhodanese-like domain-containing protein [Pseudomonadota bacterium]
MVGLFLLPPALATILVDATEAARIAADPAATVLDVRELPAYLLGHVPGAVRTDWRLGTSGSTSGKIRDPVALAAAYAALGVRSDAPVLVVGAWRDGWGDEGRVAWNLAWLGHPDVHVLRGGMGAWRKGTEMVPSRPDPGAFVAQVDPTLRVDARALRNGPDAWTIVDVRTPAEFAGATPYGELRGGHLPGAVNVEWGDLLAAPPTLPRDKPVAVYCTGGVRSGMAWVALADAGYTVANYDGSWWEWSALYDVD